MYDPGHQDYYLTNLVIFCYISICLGLCDPRPQDEICDRSRGIVFPDEEDVSSTTSDRSAIAEQPFYNMNSQSLGYIHGGNSSPKQQDYCLLKCAYIKCIHYTIHCKYCPVLGN